MSEWLEAGRTVLTAVVIYILGQWVLKSFIEPWLDFRRHLGEIADSVNYYANVGGHRIIVEHYMEALQILAEAEVNGTLDRVERLRAERLETQIRQMWTDSRQAQQTIRRQATQLLSKAEAIPLYRLWQFLPGVPRRAGILRAHNNLIGLSNEVVMERSPSTDRRSEIARDLKLKMVRMQVGR